MNFQNVRFEASYGLFQQIPPCEMPEFAFSGRSNVGKSSLINKLFNRKQLARVSAMPGKTTTINFFRLDQVRFADLPGYGYAKVSKKEKNRWSGLIGDYLASDRDIALVFQLIDMRHPPTKDDLMMIDYLVECEMPFAIVLTKMDKLSRRQQQERLAAIQTEIPYADQITILPVSSETGEGIEEIRQIIEELSCREEENDAPSDAQADSKAVPEETIGFGQAENTDDMEEAIRRFRESVRSGELEKKQQEKLPTRQRKKGETCL
ncbi:MAG TPA: YihA family ribosome biogenesis GTP-binding protein [Ruminococcaceae bacterium]|nr:YihA family ribosome biogenesis GTP-binding protein [Oscillospiraceae bacterium]HCU32613.1 YihA family ribosome biogenesis GTP-binding protein [Oscillospiraceae bacterium]